MTPPAQLQTDREDNAVSQAQGDESTAQAILSAASEEQRATIRRAIPDWEVCRAILASRRRISPGASDRELVEWMHYYAVLRLENVPFHQEFKRLLFAEPRLRGRVLDVGSSGHIPPLLLSLPSLCSQLDGVDPDPAVLHHPFLARRWNSTFENADIPDASYDLAYSFNVVEHVPDARPFFAKLRRVLKPGGVFITMTPHAQHPFSLASRLVQALRAKHWVYRLQPNVVNDYPAYYRLNARRSVLRAIEGLGFASAQFWHLHASWKIYFPRGLRWTTSVYDHLIARPIKPLRLILVYRLEASAS